ncbi:DELLA protein RGA-like [Cryptomeria japonica]|uniref:DELLA protein RGA-like n=1 Tax=Cryptomeria japonica TaxID=3369 RepID=UPI0027DA8DC8|nr:DELLA protein RGA-like [Cryptomeria japonica]
MAESSASSGYQNMPCSLPQYDFPKPPCKLDGNIPSNMSAQEIIKLAGTCYIRGFDYGRLDSYVKEDQQSLELVHLLFTSAEMTRKKQYDQAARLLMRCLTFSSQWGSPIQRLCYYFSRALQDRMERHLKPALNHTNKVDGCYSKTQSNGLAMIKSVENASGIHVIDLEIRTGVQWSGLMQSLALRHPSHLVDTLRITLVGMKGEELIDSGRRLDEFIEALAIPFFYRIVEISSMEDIHEDVIVRLRPRIMVNIEVEGEHNSRCFENRFIEVLFYCNTWFDCLDVIFPDRLDTCRVMYEEVFSGKTIRNLIACERKDRWVRYVGTDVWRCLFNHKGLKEISFSYPAWYQARILLKEFPHGEYYTLEANGSAVTIGWKGTQLLAIFAWTCS